MRTISTAVDSAINSGNVPLLILVEMDFASGFLRLNNSSSEFTWDGKTWTGFGAVGQIESIIEASDLSANGIAFQISGLPADYVSIALNQKYQGRALRIWYAVLDSNYAVLSDPIGPFSFRMDTMDIEVGTTASIRVSAESRLLDWERNSVSRYTHEEQQQLYPGDLGLEFVPQMAEKQIKWGYT